MWEDVPVRFVVDPVRFVVDPPGADTEQAALSVPAFFQALHVVFLHETYLLTLRQLAFGGRSQSGDEIDLTDHWAFTTNK